MSDVETDSAAAEGWRLRPLILSIVGAIAAVIVQQLLDKKGFTTSPLFEVETWRIALAAAVGVGAGAYCFAVERARALWSLVFSLAVGVVAGLVFYWNGSGWDVWYDWHTASAFLAIAISVPLFQTARDHGGWRFAYPDVHGHAWTNVVLWCACWLFVDVVFALA